LAGLAPFLGAGLTSSDYYSDSDSTFLAAGLAATFLGAGFTSSSDSSDEVGAFFLAG
jgi:hypothetical protein